MERREFLKVAGATMLVSTVPAQARATEPRTAAELAAAFEGLFPNVEKTNKAYVQVTDSRCTYRVWMMTYGLGVPVKNASAIEAEAVIVRNLWESFQAIARQPVHAGGTLIWRQHPYFSAGTEDWERCMDSEFGPYRGLVEDPHKLTTRFAILPAPERRNLLIWNSDFGRYFKPQGRSVEVLHG